MPQLRLSTNQPVVIGPIIVTLSEISTFFLFNEKPEYIHTGYHADNDSH